MQFVPIQNNNINNSPKKLSALSHSALSTPREFPSRLHKYIWSELQALCRYYHPQGYFRDSDIHNLIKSIFKQCTQAEVDTVIFNLLRIQANHESGRVSFPEFASFFLRESGELGMSRFAQMHRNTKKVINREDFVILVKNSYSYISFSPVNDQLFYKIFYKIDSNRDGLISFAQFTAWTSNFVSSVKLYTGSPYEVEEDDQFCEAGKSMIVVRNQKESLSMVTNNSQMNKMGLSSESAMSTSRQRLVTKLITPLCFSDLDLALEVRRKVEQTLGRFDRNNNALFQVEQIIQALQTILREDSFEVQYVIRNVSKFDKDNDKRIELQQLANFFLEVHCGEMAIQRMHRKDSYARGSEQLMNLKEFRNTITYALSFFEVIPRQNQLAKLFQEIDRNQDGWISYSEYFQFLRFYFGRSSEVAINGLEKLENVRRKEVCIILDNDSLSLEERFRRLIMYQLEWLLYGNDHNSHGRISKEDIVDLLSKVFRYLEDQIVMLIREGRLFRLEAEGISFNQFLEFICNYHIRRCFANWETHHRISSDEFNNLIMHTFAFSLFKPPVDHLEALYNTLLEVGKTDITQKQYLGFLESIISGRFQAKAKLLKAVISLSSSTSLGLPFDDEQYLYQEIWADIMGILAGYDYGNKGFLDEQEVDRLSKETLRENVVRNIRYIKYNMLARDKATSMQLAKIDTSSVFIKIVIKIQIQAQFILNFSGENTLQCYTRRSTPQVTSLSKQEFCQVVQQAYKYLNCVRNRSDTISKIFDRMNRDMNNRVAVSQILTWVHYRVAKYSCF